MALWALALIVVGAVALAAWLSTRRGDTATAPVVADAPAREPAAADVAARPPADAAPPPPEDDDGGEDLLGPDEEAALRWSAVDLDAVRDAMPDNLYWETSAPTSDPEQIRLREEERERWNTEYGKVLSGFATEDEIRGYYAHRERVSADAIEFASYLLDRYRETIPERDVGLLELAIRLHHARLEEIPRRLAEALERKQEKDALREAWLEDEAAFGAAPSDRADEGD